MMNGLIELGRKLTIIGMVSIFAFVYSVLGYLALTKFNEGDKGSAVMMLFCIFFMITLTSGTFEVKMK